jgi:hypothetical protein
MQLKRRRAERRGPDPASMLAAPTVATADPRSPASDTQSAPSSPPSFDRPNNLIGLVSDITRNRDQGYTLLIVAGGMLVILTVCFAGGIWAIVEASRGSKSIPLLPAVLAGLPSASFLVFLTSRVKRWIVKIKRWLKKSANGGGVGSSAG